MCGIQREAERFKKKTQCIRTDHPGKSKITQLDHTVAGQQDVLRLHVAVYTVVAVAVRDALEGLPNYLFGQQLWTTLFLRNWNIIIIDDDLMIFFLLT